MKYYCDYCDTYLTHDSPSVRKTHCNGRKHKENVRVYYQKWLEEQVQKLVDDTTAAFKAGKIQSNPFSNNPSGPPGGAMIPPPPSLGGKGSAPATAVANAAAKVAVPSLPGPNAMPGPQPGPMPGPMPGPLMMGHPGPGPMGPMMPGMRPPMGPMGPHVGPMGPMGPMMPMRPMMAGPPKMMKK